MRPVANRRNHADRRRRGAVPPCASQTLAVIEQESASRPCAVSPKGAQGLMQLMPAAVEQFQVTDPNGPNGLFGGGVEIPAQLLRIGAGAGVVRDPDAYALFIGED